MTYLYIHRMIIQRYLIFIKWHKLVCINLLAVQSFFIQRPSTLNFLKLEPSYVFIQKTNLLCISSSSTSVLTFANLLLRFKLSWRGKNTGFIYTWYNNVSYIIDVYSSVQFRPQSRYLLQEEPWRSTPNSKHSHVVTHEDEVL